MRKPKLAWPGPPLRHVKQLQTGSPTAGKDCGPSALLMGEQRTAGDFRPGRDLHADWISAFRRHMTRFSFWPATSLPNLLQAASSATVEGAFLALGLFRPVAGWTTMTHKEVTDRLRSGQSLVVGINYGTLNDLMPALSGSKTFRGGHFIMLGGYAGPDVPDKDGFRPREEWTRLGDPLHDGRQSYPKGWQTVRVRRYLRAAETFGAAGKGRAKVLALRKAKER